MLFVFDKPGNSQDMWMLNMQFSIDIIWFDVNGNVTHIEKNVPPCGNGYYRELLHVEKMVFQVIVLNMC